jgi:hypothetical protein
VGPNVRMGFFPCLGQYRLIRKIAKFRF